MIDSVLDLLNSLVYQSNEGMVHPGLSVVWVAIVIIIMSLMIVFRVVSLSVSETSRFSFVFESTRISTIPVTFSFIKKLISRPYLVTTLRIISSAVFLLVIAAGLFGTPLAERNMATMLTWTLWWSGVVISVFFIGSGWCAICPWDAIATWLVRRRLWRRGSQLSSLNLRVPKKIRNIWPAVIMFVVLTWLELGVGVTTSPYATALLALLIVVLATVSLSLFERKAFCRYFCAVGRTLGAYGGIAPVALRPIDGSVCAKCKTLECYHGTDVIEPCPTHLVMGSLTQNTYCTSCGACTQSCPSLNISWQIRPVGAEIVHASRPHWDEAWFILSLLSLTLFHGFTMMPYWENWMLALAYQLGDSGRLLLSFSLGMTLAMIIPIALYCASISWLHKISPETPWRRIFSAMAFSILPLAFTYHIAHNLNHLVRESAGFWSVLLNPFGTQTLPLSTQELHFRHMNPLVADDVIFVVQALLILFGFYLSIKIASNRMMQLGPYKPHNKIKLFFPMTIFISLISLMSLWLLMQPMIMRM